MAMDLIVKEDGYVGPSFSFKNRAQRMAWNLTWLIFARWTPPPLRRWRTLLLKLFGARVSWNASVYPSARIWAPWNLTMDDFATLGPGVTCYNIDAVSVGFKATVSQNAHLCTGSHNYRDPGFQLTARPIAIRAHAWVCANAFVGPGVEVGEGAILAANGVAFSSLLPQSIYKGNPAVFAKHRHAAVPHQPMHPGGKP